MNGNSERHAGPASVGRVFCAVPPVPLQGRPFGISVRNEKGRLSKGPVKLSWSDPTLKVCRADGSQVANGAEFELPGGVATFHAVPSEATATFTITALGPDGESGRTSDQIVGWTNPGIGTQTVAQQPLDRSRKTIGIGEEVRLTVKGNTMPVTWVAPDEVLSSKTGSSILLTAPEVPCVLAVIANFNNRDFRVVFQVIKPSGIRFQYDSTVFVTLPNQAKWYGLSTKNNVYIAPDTVNFYRLRFCESESEVLGLTGAYKGEKLGRHPKNGPHSATGTVLPGFGTRLNLQDYLAGRSPSMPFENGSYYWLITWSYTVGKEGTTNYELEDVEQRFDFKAYNSATGKFTISKKDVSAWIEGTSDQLKHN